jgi:hypothetical protein
MKSKIENELTEEYIVHATEIVVDLWLWRKAREKLLLD